MTGFDTPITHDDGALTGPARRPRQMLADQEYGGHASVHDEATAAGLGLSGAPIEGPTHFSQFDPLAFEMWGQEWFERGTISSHFLAMVVEGEEVIATLTPTGEHTAEIGAVKGDGTPVLTGTATIGDQPTELRRRVAELAAGDPGTLHIVDQITLGDRSVTESAVVDATTPNGKLYPFSLADKLAAITENHPWYSSDDNPWGRAILPFEMYSVLAHQHASGFPVRGPSLGLFVDLEVGAVDGPLFVGEPYRLEHEVVAIGQSRRIEWYVVETKVLDAGGTHRGTVLLNSGVFKASYADYPT